MAKIKAKVKMKRLSARHWLHSLGGYEKSNGSFRQGVSMHQCLEPLAVVGLKQMGKLVHNHIILDPLRKFGQLAADANGPGGTVAGPTPALLV